MDGNIKFKCFRLNGRVIHFVYKKEDNFSATKEQAIKELLELICNNRVSHHEFMFFEFAIVKRVSKIMQWKVASMMNEKCLSALIK